MEGQRLTAGVAVSFLCCERVWWTRKVWYRSEEGKLLMTLDGQEGTDPASPWKVQVVGVTSQRGSAQMEGTLEVVVG